MKIELREITIRELTQGYEDKGHDGVFGYEGKLDIRPPYQREFIYKPEQRDKVIDTINKNFPLNVMYWAEKENGSFEVIDGQQRTISICQFFNGDFSFDFRYFHNLNQGEQDIFLDYKLMVYICSGTETEKLGWFKTINISGEPLTNQEMRNAVFSGSWVTDAKMKFSKNGCPASLIGGDYMNGAPIRQDYLETAIDWISKGNIEVYMGNHQKDPNSNAIWTYFQSVITWVSVTFTHKRKFMKGVNWGFLFDNYHNEVYDTKQLEEETQRLLLDDDVTKKSGIYPYLLTKDEKYLSIRSFSDGIKHKVYIKQDGKCMKCGLSFSINEMEADHIDPWHSGGKTNEDNCQLLCKSDNRRKGGI